MLTPSQMKYGVLGKLSAARQKIQYRNFQPVCGEDAVVRGIDDQVAYLTRLLDRGNMELFLKRLAETVSRLHDACWGRGLFIPELDELARKASLTIAPTPNPPVNSGTVLHVTTGVYSTGGHTRVIQDIVANLPEYRHELTVTGMTADHPDLLLLKPWFDHFNLNIHILSSSSLTARSRELSHLLAALRPEIITLFGNNNDVVLNVTVTHRSASRVLFFHHVDHYPCLGASRSEFTHVDLTPGCHDICLNQPILNASMVGLTVRDAGTVRPTENRSITGATCGSPHKYDGSIGFSYGQLLAALFSVGVGKMFHVGDMSEEQKNETRAEVTANGQDAERIIFLPNVPSLTEKLLEISPDFYLVSHPVGGGKATLEAMSVGLPILHARPAGSLPLLVVDMTYGSSLTVSTLDEIPVVLKRLTDEGQVLSRRTRATYEKYYSEAAFRQGLLSAIGR